MNFLGSTMGTNPVDEWEEGKDSSEELQSGNKASNGILRRGTMMESYTHFVKLCVSHAAESNICSA